MKKFFFIFISLFIPFLCFPALRVPAPLDYPSEGTSLADKPVEIYMNKVDLYGGDRVGHVNTGEEPSDTDVLGLVWFAGGIDVHEGGGTYVLFASPLPVCNSIGLNDGSNDFLVLMEDLHLSSSVNLISSGGIEAKYGSFILNGIFNLMNNRITFLSGFYPSFNGKGNILDFSDGGRLNVIGTQAYFNDVYLKNLKNESIYFNYPESSTLTFTKSIIKLGGDVCFNHDVVVQAGELFVTGTNRTICFNRKLEVKNGASLKMDYGTTFSLGYYGYIQTGGTGKFHFNDCDIEVGQNYGLDSEINNGFNLKNGKVIFENTVTIKDDSNFKHFIVGENSQAKLFKNTQIVLDGTTTFSIL